jgi:hypothetical protein
MPKTCKSRQLLINGNMKNLVMLFSILIIMAGCTKDKESTSNSNNIVIKGTIRSSGNAKSTALKSSNSFLLSDARKVLVFNSNSYSVYNISDSTFSAQAPSGTACALSFLTENNEFIGCLHAGGLNVLPLVSLKDGDKTVIDLSNLTQEGTNIIPGNNPLGNEIGLNAEEIDWYKEIGGFYESLSKNIDVDNDGVIDVLSKKDLRVSSSFMLHAGVWGLNEVNPVIYDTSEIRIGYSMRFSYGENILPDNAESAVLTGPNDDPYNDISMLRFATADRGFLAFFNRAGEGQYFPPFKKGEYTMTVNSIDYTINYATVCPKIYLIFAEPTLHTDNNGDITSISVKYKRFDGSTVNPDNFIYLIQLQLMSGNQVISLGARLYSDQNPSDMEKYNFVLTTPLALTNLFQLDVYYQDLLGNEYNIFWDKNNAQ